MKILFDRLAALNPGSSKTSIRSWLKEGRVEVDGTVETDGKRLLEEAAKVRILPKKPKKEAPFPTLFKDSHLIVVDKPTGILTVTTDSRTEESLHGLLKESYGKVWPVHRLDKETSGLLVFALSEEAKEGLKAQFAAHSIERIYHALVEGSLEKESGSFRSFLWEDRSYIVHSSQDPKAGKEAISHFQVLKRSKNYTLIELKLETGRKNQIRVHCQEAGHPVAGDKKYGATTDPIRRVALHAAVLGFIHPVTKKKLLFRSETPKNFTISG